LRVLEELATGKAVERPQDDSQATTAPKLSRELTRLDFSRNGEELCRQIRGLYPWPGCRVRLLDAAGVECAKLTLVRARPVSGEGSRWHGGEIMMNGCVAAGNNTGLELMECQPESKRPMSLADYQRGHCWLPGMRIESLA
jgi:methionyl-tRNA formyltransferase